MSKGFCDHCYSWGEIADEERNMCDTCKQIETGRALRNERLAKKSVRSLPKGNAGGRG